MNLYRAKVMLEKITEATIRYLCTFRSTQDVTVIQIFDSWGGMLSPAMYDEFSLPYLERITKAVKDRVPVILQKVLAGMPWISFTPQAPLP